MLKLSYRAFWLTGLVLTGQAYLSAESPKQTGLSLAVTAPALARAHAFARAVGKVADGEPQVARLGTDPVTAEPCVGFGWHLFAVKANLISGKIVSYDDVSDEKDVEAAFKEDRPTTVPERQAVAVVRRMIGLASATPGDWRPDVVELTEWTEGQKSWVMSLHRYVEGRPCSAEYVYAHVNPYVGNVQTFKLFDGAIRLPENGPLLPEARARHTAIGAFRKGGGEESVQPKLLFGGPAWYGTANHEVAPVCRLGYTYQFLTTFRFEGHESHQLIQVAVDAVTDELWGAASMLGTLGGTWSAKGLEFSPRITLSGALRSSKDTFPLGRSVLSGDWRAAVPSPVGGIHFHCQAGKRDVEFVWTARTRELAWKNNPGQWLAVRLSDAESQRMAAWLARPHPSQTTPGVIR